MLQFNTKVLDNHAYLFDSSEEYMECRNQSILCIMKK